jgi:predicted RNA-binding protein Jag
MLRLFKKKEVAGIPTVSEETQKQVRLLVRDYIRSQGFNWDVKMLKVDYETLPDREGKYIVVSIYTPNPEMVIGVRGAIAHALSAFISNKISALVYTRGVYFDPFKCTLPC